MKTLVMWLALAVGSVAAAQNFPPLSGAAPHVWLLETVGLVQVEELPSGEHKLFVLGSEDDARVLHLQRINTEQRQAVLPVAVLTQLGCALSPADLDRNVMRVQCGRLSAGVAVFDYTQ